MLIREKDRALVVSLAQKSFTQPLELWAYGSRVNGEAHETSDLDMVVVTPNNAELNLTELLNFKEMLQESNIPILTQVLDWNRIPKSFHKNILKNYVVLVRIGYY
jgi:predicted nucleotidyltransferase